MVAFIILAYLCHELNHPVLMWVCVVMAFIKAIFAGIELKEKL